MTEITTTSNKEHLYDVEYQIPYRLRSIHLVNQEQKSINLKELVAGFQIYESLHDKFLSGEVVFVDGINLPRLFRFTGQEYIRVSLSDGREDSTIYDLTFRVSRMHKNVRSDVGVMQGYTLNIEDPSMLKGYTKRINRVLRGKQSDMLKTILLDKEGLGLTEDDLGIWQNTESDKNQFICPNWRINELITHFVRECDFQTNASWRNGMFFYQTFDGKFNLKSIDEMCNTNPDDMIKLIYKPTAGGLDKADRDRKQILSMSKPKLFNSIKGTVSGLYASMSETLETITGVVKENVYDIEETISRNPNHVEGSGTPIIRTEVSFAETGGDEMGFTTKDQEGDKPPEVIPVDKWKNKAPNLQKENVIIYNSHSAHTFDNNTDVESDEVFSAEDTIKNNAILERRALMELMEQNTISLVLPIRTDLTVGNVVQLVIPEPEIQDETSDSKDVIHDNKYLVVDSCITVNNQRQTGSLHIECVKETFTNVINEEAIEEGIDKASKPYFAGLSR